MGSSTALFNKCWPMSLAPRQTEKRSNVAEALSPVFFHLMVARFCILDQTIQMLSGLRYRAKQICAWWCWSTDNGGLLPDCGYKKKIKLEDVLINTIATAYLVHYIINNCFIRNKCYEMLLLLSRRHCYKFPMKDLKTDKQIPMNQGGLLMT